MSSVFHTSDHHLGHRLVAGHRGFGEDTDAHDEAICENYIKVVKPGDTVYFYGDISVGGRTRERRALEIISKWPATKHFITGNHDSVFPKHRDADKMFKEYMQVFDSIFPYRRKKLNGEEVELCHFPFSKDHTEEPRYVEHRRVNRGQWLLHGHTHDEIVKDGMQIHTGLDAHHLSPVNQEVIIDLMKDPRDFITKEDFYG